jgi:ribonuclease D
MSDALLLTNDEQLGEWTRRIAMCDPVAVDTEGDSLHCYFEKLCLIQVSIPETDVLVDPLASLDFTDFCRVLANRTTVFHGCDYDLRMLRRGIGFVPGEVFDTYLAARLVGLKEVGLASLVKYYFDIDLPKSSQKANWARRPLTPTMAQYALNDTRYLLSLAEKLGRELLDLQRWDWFTESVQRAVAAAAEDREKDPERIWKIPGSTTFRGQALAMLRAVWHWREAEAQKVDRPGFQILHNEELIELVKGVVESNAQLPARFSPSRRKQLQAAIDAALALPESEWPQRVRSGRSRPTEEEERRLDELRLKRDKVATELNLDPGVVAPRQALERISREPAAATQVLMRWQRELMGIG